MTQPATRGHQVYGTAITPCIDLAILLKTQPFHPCHFYTRSLSLTLGGQQLTQLDCINSRQSPLLLHQTYTLTTSVSSCHTHPYDTMGQRGTPPDGSGQEGRVLHAQNYKNLP